MGIDDSVLEDIEVAALLHDVGKIGIPDAILEAPPLAPPKDADEDAPRVRVGDLRLFASRAGQPVRASSSRNSHGNGYPAGLHGDEIPIGPYVGVIDAFDAMTSNRPYRSGLPFEEAIDRLELAKATQFDPDVVDCFVRIAYDENEGVFAATGTGVAVAV